MKDHLGDRSVPPTIGFTLHVQVQSLHMQGLLKSFKCYGFLVLMNSSFIVRTRDVFLSISAFKGPLTIKRARLEVITLLQNVCLGVENTVNCFQAPLTWVISMLLP